MSNSNSTYNPIFKQPTPSLCPAKVPTKSELPSEMQELDGCPVAAISPADNSVLGPVGEPGLPGQPGAVAMRPTNEPADNTEFNLFPDGTMMKFIERPGFAPQCLLVDGTGRQFGIARNSGVADLICNGVNFMHLAAVTHEAEKQAQARGEIESVEGKAPPLIITPNSKPSDAGIIPGPTAFGHSN